MGRDAQKRKKIIAANYKPLHPHLYTLQVNLKHVYTLNILKY